MINYRQENFLNAVKIFKTFPIFLNNALVPLCAVFYSGDINSKAICLDVVESGTSEAGLRSPDHS